MGASLRVCVSGGDRGVRLTVVMPTIPGREHWVERTTRKFEEFTAKPFELLVLEDTEGKGCGPIWQKGGDLAKGDYIFMAADDLEPKAAGWDDAAIAACDRGTLPAPLIYYPDGRLQSCGEHWEMLDDDGEETSFTRAPFMSRAQLAKIGRQLPTLYWTDNWVSWRGWKEAIPTVITYGFDLIHHLAPEGRNSGRMAADGEIFTRATRGEDVWQES